MSWKIVQWNRVAERQCPWRHSVSFNLSVSKHLHYSQSGDGGRPAGIRTDRNFKGHLGLLGISRQMPADCYIPFGWENATSGWLAKPAQTLNFEVFLSYRDSVNGHKTKVLYIVFNNCRGRD